MAILSKCSCHLDVLKRADFTLRDSNAKSFALITTVGNLLGTRNMGGIYNKISLTEILLGVLLLALWLLGCAN